MTNPSTSLARAVVGALIEAGVREVVVAPGSRNAPLSFAVYDAAAAGRLRLHTRSDERTAAFLALGLTKVGSRAAVMCTSGTAVANLHPAVLEAAHAGVPLVVVTADRPARLRGTNANQTTDQVGIFASAAPCLDLSASAAPDPEGIRRHLEGPPSPPRGATFATSSGPVHLNVQFDEPLLPTASTTSSWEAGPETRRSGEFGPSKWQERPREVARTALPSGEDGPRTVVVAGDDAGPPARVLAEQANWPLFAEPTSGSRTGTNVIRTYRLLLDGDLGERIERVVVFGHPTLSRPVQRLLARDDVEIWSGPAPGRWAERPFDIDTTFDALDVADPDDPAWLDEWHQADTERSVALDRLLAAEPELTPYDVAGAVSAALPPGGLLYVGASSPIRDLDLMGAEYAVGDRRKVIANRGLAGIDGTISSAIGAALGRPRSSRSLALMGDVTFLHDSTALMLGPAEARPDLTVVVVNDDGGSIFSMLEQGDPAYADRFESLFGTPHRVDLASLCAATRTPHWRVDNLAELRHALANPNGGIEVVEAVCRRDNRRELDARIRALGSS